jgi:2,5-diketo-D-gluconate reductase A
MSFPDEVRATFRRGDSDGVLRLAGAEVRRAAPPVRPTVEGMTEQLVLNNGVTMPALGLGVFQSPPEETAAAVETALTVGYRHIDTAAAYGNERQVGEGLRRSGVDRGEVFLETKVWVSDYGYDETLHAFDKATRKLGVDRLDLLILHQPATDRFDRTVDAYRALEKLLADGAVRAIGVSNFMRHHLTDLLARTEIVPAVNQIELHPYFSQPDVQKADAEHGILTQAWSPIGGITFYPGWGEERKNVLEDPAIGAVAAGHGRSPAQVMLRWQLQHGRSAIPKSTNPARIAENFDVFGFTLTAAEMAGIDALDRGVRNGPDPDVPRPEMFDRVVPED